MYVAENLKLILARKSGANATTFEFTATTPARAFFQNRIKYFSFQNALGYPWSCKNLQRWRCKSKL
jgi:hypothetical protein